jgi:septum site-determining protein MinC
MVNQNIIEFKGTKDGLIIKIKEYRDFQNIKNALIAQFEKAGSFFAGAKLLDIECPFINEEERLELKTLVMEKYDLTFKEVIVEPEDQIFEGLSEGMTKFHSGTLRSGQVLAYDGNLVIFGDVNPGAVVKANGNIIVLGSLRGIAHAGANGNVEAIVSAHVLNPTQLRIADIIARSPDEKIPDSVNPEVAKVKNKSVYVESNYNGKKKGEK